MKKTAVVLFNLGGPDSPESVEPFLYNLFCDPFIISIPAGFLRKQIAKLISSKRSKFVRLQYEKVGGSSPINKWTEYQRAALEKALSAELGDVEVFTAMRYWKPLTEDTVKLIQERNFDRIILLPLYPHYSKTTTGSSYAEWDKHFDGDVSKTIRIDSYCTNSGYIQTINSRIDESLLTEFPEEIRSSVELVFSAHGVPVSIIKKGDPYKDQIEATIREVMAARNDRRNHHLCFQSKVGPVKWLKPSTFDMLKRLSEVEKLALLIIPISFVSDHLETQFELGIENKKTAIQAGIKHYHVMTGFNDSPQFIEALKQIVLEAVK